MHAQIKTLFRRSIYSVLSIAIAISCSTTFAQSSQRAEIESERISNQLKIQSPIRVGAKPPNIHEFETDANVVAPWRVKTPPAESALASNASYFQDSTDEKIELSQDSPSDQQSRQRPVFGPWPKKGIRGITVGIRETNSNAPADVSGQLIGSSKTDWTQFAPAPKVFAWAAPNIRYQPLYFEDVALERYGQTSAPYRQSVKSSVHFFKSMVTLPNKMRHDSWRSCDYPYGFCRPGDAVPATYQLHYFGQPGR